MIQQSGAGLPPVANWGYAGPDWAMDPDVVNNPLYAGTIKDDLKAVPTVSLVMPWNDWFGGGRAGDLSRRRRRSNAPSRWSTSPPTARSQFQIDGGIEIQGGTSDDRWKMDKLSMRVKFKEPYGPEKLDADIFNDGAQDDGAAASFNTFILDAHMGYTWAYGGGDQRRRPALAGHVRAGRATSRTCRISPAAPRRTSRLVHLYINGLYWGMYDMHERADEHFAESYLGGNDEDYDVIKHNATNVVSADLNNPNSAINNYAAMLNLVRQNMTVQANYDAAAAKLDVDDFITYMIVNYYVGNDDWAHQNWYATFNRVDPAGKWRYHSWDAENVLKRRQRDSTTLNNVGGPTEVFQRLIVESGVPAAVQRRRAEADVQRRLADARTARPPSTRRGCRRSTGRSSAKSTAGATATRRRRDPPGAGNPYLRTHWVNRQNELLSTYFPYRTNVVLSQFSTRNWLVSTVAPTFSHYGGTVPAGHQLTIAKPARSPASGILYYTLDGSDPRLPGGGVAPAAVAVAGSSTTLTLTAGTRVRARVFDAAQAGTTNDWSAEINATFLLETPFPLRITELQLQSWRIGRRCRCPGPGVHRTHEHRRPDDQPRRRADYAVVEHALSVHGGANTRVRLMDCGMQIAGGVAAGLWVRASILRRVTAISGKSQQRRRADHIARAVRGDPAGLLVRRQRCVADSAGRQR